MAKPVVVIHLSATSSFQLSRLERRKLYVFKCRMPVASAGQACTRAGLPDDGAVLIRDSLTFRVDRWRPGRSEPRTAMALPFHRWPPPSENRWISRSHCPPPICQTLQSHPSTAWSPNLSTTALVGHFRLANSGGFPSTSEPISVRKLDSSFPTNIAISLLGGMLIELRFLAPNAPPPPEEVAGSEDDLDVEML